MDPEGDSGTIESIITLIVVRVGNLILFAYP